MQIKLLFRKEILASGFWKYRSATERDHKI